MTTYAVNLYATRTLNNNYGSTPLDRAETYIRGAFDYVSEHGVVVGQHSDAPLMYEDEFTHDDNGGCAYEQHPLDGEDGVSDPCNSYTWDYGGIGYFFEDWLHCNGNPSDWDVHVLLTAIDSGGGHTIHYSDYSVCVVTGGNSMVDAPSSFTRYEPADQGTAEAKALDAIQTLTHEMGHAFLHDDEDVHPDHNYGAVTKTTSSNYWVTPMGMQNDDTSVCQSYDLSSYDVTGDRRWDVVWSDCLIDRWESNLG